MPPKLTLLAAIAAIAASHSFAADSKPQAPSALALPSGTQRKALADALMAREKSGTPDALFQDNAYRVALAAHEVLRVTGDEPVALLQKRYPDFSRFLSVFLSDRAWMEAYLAAGVIPTNNEYGLETLYKIWKADGASPDFGKYRHLSAAIAAGWGAGRNAEHLRDGAKLKPFSINPVWRFQFYKERNKAKRLDPMFDSLKSWELHYVVTKVWDDASLAWANENVNIPLQRYVDACWAVNYQGDSDFGDTVQGPLFYKPWDTTYCAAENAKLHGGVCGSLSTFGATAAAAHGIPSYTVGQPGHCAYAVRFARGDWRGGFGGPDGGIHTAIWSGNIHYVELMEAVFGDDTGLNLALARAARARLLLQEGDLPAAEKAIADAVSISPMHLDIRRDQIAIMEKAGGKRDWQKYAENLLVAFGKHSNPAIDLTREFDWHFLTDLDEEQKLAWYSKVHDAISQATPSWQWGDELDEKILDPEYKSLRSDQGREKFLKMAFAAQLKSGSYFGKVLEWGVKTFISKGKAELFANALESASSGGGSADGKAMREAYEKAIAAGCEAKSIPAFQALGKASLRFARNGAAPAQLDLPSGKLVSDGGVLWPSSQSWCSAVDFYNVLNKTGGLVHTKEESRPSVTVQLPSEVELSGVLVVKSNGNEGRMKKVLVSRSVDGATWFPVQETESMPKQWRVEPPGGTRARWIKVEALNDRPEFMHFSNILVFAKE